MTHHRGYYECDECGAQADDDLTPEGWTFANGVCVYCATCSRKRKAERAAPDGSKADG